MTDRPDDALSSDELIRRAREGLDVPDAAPPSVPEAPAAAEVPSQPTFSADEPSSPVEPSSARPTDWLADRSPEPAVDRSPEPASTSDESLLPSHFQPEHAGGATAEPSLWQKIGSKSGLIFALIFGGILLFRFFGGDTAVDDLGIGDCFLDPAENEFAEVETVDCVDPHDYEVFALVPVSGIGDGYPGDDYLVTAADATCFTSFLDYVGLDETATQTDYLYEIFIPGEDAWDGGSREAMCAAFGVDADFNQIRTSGSARVE